MALFNHFSHQYTILSTFSPVIHLFNTPYRFT